MAGSKRRGSSSSSSGSPGMFSRKGTAPAAQPASAPRQMPPPSVPASLPQKLPPQTSTASSMPKPATPAPTSSASPMAPTSAPQGSTFPPRAPGAPGAYPQAPMGGMPMGGMPGGMGQPSMMRSIISSAIGSAVGVTASHALMNAFSSGDKEQLAQISQQEQGGKCGIQFQSFLKCLENNSSNVNSCQWASDMLNQCKAENPQ